ncbi:MAG: hypothetical protein AAB649_04200 [Patescibacteria group bacterium]
MRRLRTLGLLLSVLALPYLVHAQNPRTFKELADQLATIMNSGVTILITAGIVIYFWGAVRHIMENGESENSWEMRKFLFTGLIVIFVMVSIWGILSLLQNTLFQGSNNISV